MDDDWIDEPMIIAHITYIFIIYFPFRIYLFFCFCILRFMLFAVLPFFWVVVAVDVVAYPLRSSGFQYMVCFEYNARKFMKKQQQKRNQ